MTELEYTLQLIKELSDKMCLHVARIDQRIDGVKEASALLAKMLEKSNDHSAAVLEKRFESVNEFRAQMGDMQATLARRAEVDLKFEARKVEVDAKLEALAQKMESSLCHVQTSDGRSSGIEFASNLLFKILPLVGTAIAILIAVLK